MSYILSHHAQSEMERRGIPLSLVEAVLANPQQIIIEKEGRQAYQSKLDFGEGRIFLLRVIVVDNIEPMVVVTVYRTSRIEKYWTEP